MSGTRHRQLANHGEEVGQLYYLWGHGWQELRIRKVTATFFFVDDPDHKRTPGDAVDRQQRLVRVRRKELRDKGWTHSEDERPGRFYSAKGRPGWTQSPDPNDLAALDRYLASVGLRPILADERQILEISGELTRASVLAAFRRQVRHHHPDQGGNAEKFRLIVEAKERLLELVGDYG